MIELVGIVLVGIAVKILGSFILNALCDHELDGQVDYNQFDYQMPAQGYAKRHHNDSGVNSVPDLILQLGAYVPEENLKPGSWYQLKNGVEIRVDKC